MRQREAAAVGCPKSPASVGLRHRRTIKPMVPELSAASCRRREATMGNRTNSATTAPSPPNRKASSKLSSTYSSRTAST